MILERRLATDAVAALLRTATGTPCGLGTVPLTDGRPADPPYTVLHALPLTLSGAPFSDLNEDASSIYQVDCVARQHQQAEWLADKVRSGVLSRRPDGAWRHPLPLAGWNCYARALDLDAGPDNDAAAGIVSYPLRFRLGWTPAAPAAPAAPATLEQAVMQARLSYLCDQNPPRPEPRPGPAG
ncbi:hypothetical protein [Streptomyces sp. CC224B]|uniref:hypothetical protein n=1 Tax=Streptomyces sp. CC224B TaxID=3044571 RepID=UPI0024A9BF29|nr:hypothetical protein [Streptomyces sp. CC224B]